MDKGTGLDQENGTPAGGNEQEPKNYGGFETPEELANAYTEQTSKLDSLNQQVADLERIKGDNRGQISQLRQQIATLSGQIEGMKSTTPQNQAQQGPSIDDIQEDLQKGKIDEAEAIKMAAEVTANNVKNTLSKTYKEDLKREFDAFKADLEHQQQVQKFLSDNPGYTEAFNSGKLDQWLTIDPVTGEKTGGMRAWEQYQMHSTMEELKQLKEQEKKRSEAAKKAGVEEGLALSETKSNHSKVLNGKGGQFAQIKGNYDLANSRDRNAAAQEYLKQLRGSGG